MYDLGISADRLALSPEYFGLVFDSMAIRDLRAHDRAGQARFLAVIRARTFARGADSCSE
ncbi:MAG: hypothetical protein DI573_10910 [Microbacterium sp.]|uniref:hypothetical protein n=1 Tax=Microbacterium sp. TaxID=51671 RepID=UPI000DB87C7A|nr:hypothetical protein [Microbacterium sp.]PZU37833.1 MAG: hypothetical protein DI573_10910 [Microbacterium sp.]